MNEHDVNLCPCEQCQVIREMEQVRINKGQDVAQAKKNDNDKLRYDLIPPYALEEVVKVFGIGAKKYGDHNYRKGLGWSRIYAAMMRHLEAWRRGEDDDPVDGQKHLASVAWGAMALLEYSHIAKELDDRPAWLDEKWLQWKDTPYWISSCGRIKKNEKFLSGTDNGAGYFYISIWKNNQIIERLYIHRAVAILFIREPEEDEMVNHRNGNRADNVWTNLEWVTSSGNNLAAYQNGRPRLKPGKKNDRVK